MSAVLHLDLLGGYRASAGPDGSPIDFPTKKSALLLVPIVIDQPAPSRDRLAALLWSNRQEQQGRGSLRQAIFTMRTTLREAGAMEPITRQDRISMAPETVACDVIAFRNAARGSTIEDLEKARRLYKGPFLGTVRLPDPEFAAWVEDTGQTLLRAAEAVGVDLAALYRDAGDLGAATDALDWVLTLDPTREDVHRSLMRLHLEAGNRTLALRQYRNCVAVLERELGVPPDRETLALFDAISSGTLTASVGKTQASPFMAGETEGRPQRPAVQSVVEPVRPTNPDIAVLPFSLLSDDVEAAHLGEGLFEDLTSDLPKFHQVRCKTRNAALSAIESGIPRNRVGASIQANYVVDGSIRASGNRVRVNAQLVDVASGVQLWSDRYTVDIEDIFDTQDRLTERIIVAVTNRLKQEMLALAQRKPAAERTPYDCWLIGFSLLLKGTEDHTRQGLQQFERALEMDSHYARGHCGMSLAYFNEWGAHAWPLWNDAIEKAYGHAEEAVRLSESDHVGQCLLGRIHVYRREFDRGQRYLERSYTLNPYGTDMLAIAALSWSFLGDHGKAHDLATRAIELHPSPPEWYYGGIALSLFMTGRAEEARKIRERSPRAYPDTLAFLAADYAMNGDMVRASSYAARFHQEFSTHVLGGRQPAAGEVLDWVRHANPFRLEKDARLIEEAMSAAGIGKVE